MSVSFFILKNIIGVVVNPKSGHFKSKFFLSPGLAFSNYKVRVLGQP